MFSLFPLFKASVVFFILLVFLGVSRVGFTIYNLQMKSKPKSGDVHRRLVAIGQGRLQRDLEHLTSKSPVHVVVMLYHQLVSYLCSQSWAPGIIK